MTLDLQSRNPWTRKFPNYTFHAPTSSFPPFTSFKSLKLHLLCLFPLPEILLLFRIFVKSVKDRGPAVLAGLNIGDRLVSVNGETVAGRTYAQVVQMIQKSRDSLFLVVVPRQDDILQVVSKTYFVRIKREYNVFFASTSLRLPKTLRRTVQCRQGHQAWRRVSPRGQLVFARVPQESPVRSVRRRRTRPGTVCMGTTGNIEETIGSLHNRRADKQQPRRARTSTQRSDHQPRANPRDSSQHLHQHLPPLHIPQQSISTQPCLQLRAPPLLSPRPPRRRRRPPLPSAERALTVTPVSRLDLWRRRSKRRRRRLAS